MRVRLTTDVSGTRDGLAWPAAGSVIDLPDDEARGMVSGGAAVEVGADQPKVMVPPAGVHTPGVVGYQEPGVTHLVETPADAASDPEGVKKAIADRVAGNVMEVPVGTGVQARSGAALPRDEVESSVEAEKVARESLAAGTAPTVGAEKASAASRKPAADKPKG